MPRNGVKISMVAVLRIIIFLFLGLVLFLSYARLKHFLTHDRMFTVKDVLLESSLQFINTKPLIALKGRNIFDVDITTIEHQLSNQYPQITQLKVVRELPDKIKILARRREMLFQVSLRNKYLLVDTQGVAVIYVNTSSPLPTIIGFKEGGKVKLGRQINSGVLNTMVKVLNKMRETDVLKDLQVSNIDITNPAKISVALNKIPARILLDSEEAVEKMETLKTLLVQKKLDFEMIDYVDLRFDQPVMSSNQQDTPPGKK